MPKLERLGNVILSSILHSTEHLHHSFPAGDSQREHSHARFSSVPLGTAAADPGPMGHSLTLAGG